MKTPANHKVSPSTERAEAVLKSIRINIIFLDDYQALKYLKSLWPSLSDKEQRAVARYLSEHGYKGPAFDMLKEWAYERLHPEDRPTSPLRPVRGQARYRPQGPEYWPGKRGDFFIQGGLPGLGRRR